MNLSVELGMGFIIMIFAVAATREHYLRVSLKADNLRLKKELSEHVMLAQTDDLTGLLNARAFRSKLDHEVTRARRFGHDLTMIFVDLDNFKKVNDILGHVAGDAVLVSVSAILREAVREDFDLVARYGGDEFAILLPEAKPADAQKAAQRILDLTRVAFGSHRVPVTVSIGIAELTTASSASADLFLIADAAMYSAKRGGGNQIVVTHDNI